MKKFLIAMMTMATPFLAMAEIHEVRGVQVTELTAATSPFTSGRVFLAEPHGIPGCFNELRLDNRDHGLVGQLRYSIENPNKTIQLTIEDTVVDARQFCWVRRVTVGVR